MLQLRPTCENCGAELPPSSMNAMICSFECTFCRHCVDTILANVCPNCGGGFCARPIRPARPWKNDNYLGCAPASNKRVERPVDIAKHQAFCALITKIPPQCR